MIIHLDMVNTWKLNSTRHSNQSRQILPIIYWRNRELWDRSKTREISISSINSPKRQMRLTDKHSVCKNQNNTSTLQPPDVPLSTLSMTCTISQKQSKQWIPLDCPKTKRITSLEFYPPSYGSVTSPSSKMRRGTLKLQILQLPISSLTYSRLMRVFCQNH